jgi:DNA-damage-inducible protein J
MPQARAVFMPENNKKKSSADGKTVAAKRKTRLQVMVSQEDKERADALFQSLGMDTGTAINTFIKQSIRERRMPFHLTLVGEREREFEEAIRIAEAEPTLHGGSAQDMKNLTAEL